MNATGAPASSSDTGLYVHFPYCEKKCPYCDFNSHALEPEPTRYADAVLEELQERAGPFEAFSTVYFGGGTPSLWDPRDLGRVLSAARSRLRAGAEVTVEANPGTVHEATFDALVERGVNRFSLGVQSFLDEELGWLGRIHDARAAVDAVRRAKASGAKVSLDLIYGLPGQTRDDVTRSIDCALELDPGHVSAYTLTIEPETHFGRAYAAGRLKVMPDDDQAALIDFVTGQLEAAGYRRYEVSSYARVGNEAVHNTIYWVGGAYLGLGAGASSYVFEPALERAERIENVKAPASYLGRDRGTLARREALERHAVVADRLWTGMRTVFGQDLSELDREAGLDGILTSALSPTIDRLVDDGWVETDGRIVRPTKLGFRFADGIGRALLEAWGSVPAESLRVGNPLRGGRARRTLEIVR